MNNISIISYLFYMTNENHRCDARYKKVTDKLCKNDNYMSEALKDNSDLLNHYEAVKDALDEYDAIAVKDYFEMGFKSGLRLALEALDFSQCE